MIEATGLTKHFGAVKAVDGLTVSVPRGELFCFLGPNGAGKTTTIKMMTGLLRPTAGRVTLNGVDIQVDPLEAKKHLGYIPDMPYLYDRLTCREFFEFTGDLYKVDKSTMRRQLDDYFAQFGIEEYRDVLVKDLSHGLRQRLIYAATLLHDPKIFFIDEPLIGLDPYTIRMIKQLLRAKTRDGMTIFLTTHILALAQDIADRIGIIMHGDLIAIGSLDQLREKANVQGTLEDVFLKLTGSDELVL